MVGHKIYVALWPVADLHKVSDTRRVHVMTMRGESMEIKAVDGQLSLSSLFKPVAFGYAIGMGVIFIPMFLLMIPIMMFSPGVEDQSGQLVTGSLPIFLMMVPMIIMVPVILAMQGVMIGGAIIMGLAIYRTRRPIPVVVQKNSSQN